MNWLTLCSSLAISSVSMIGTTTGFINFSFTSSPKRSVARSVRSPYPCSFKKSVPKIDSGPTTATTLRVLTPSDDEVHNFDVEVARDRLETLVSDDGDERSLLTLKGLMLRRRPPIHDDVREREIRVREAELLRALERSDDEEEKALSEIRSHWVGERGPGPARDLLRAEELENVDVDAHEAALRRLVAEHGACWAEPVNRLAALLLKRGRSRESRACCEIVLAIKPWHFEALDGMVLTCARMKDNVNARIWKERRLPPLRTPGNDDGGVSERRREWVRRAVESASVPLTQRESFLTETVEEDDDDDDDDSGGKWDQILDGILRTEGESSWQ